MISITYTMRDSSTKGSVGRLRRNGFIPMVVYSKGEEGQMGSVPRADIEAAMRSIKPGFLPNTVFVLKDESGRERKALIKDVQYQSTTYDIIHLDFYELEEGRLVDVKIPVEFDGAAECSGVKLGGQLRHIMRHVKVRCLPANIPQHFTIDVKEMGIRQSKRVRDIAMPKTVNCLARADDVVVSVLK